MKKLIFLLAVLVIPFLVYAGNRDTGVGIIVGVPTGITAKHWLDSKNAFDGAFSISGSELYLHFDYLWHDYKAFPKPEEGKLPLYYGVGAVAKSKSGVGIRGVAGIEYVFEEYPFDTFLELAPVIEISPGINFNFTAGIGGRYFWGN